MKKQLLVFCLLSSLFCLLFTINSCKKDEPDTETTSVTDNSIAEGEFSRIFPQTNSIAVGDSGVQYLKGTYLPLPANYCPDHWLADTVFPKTMWIEYGADTTGDGVFDYGCVGNDGKKRMGKIKAVFASPWSVNGANVSMELMDYFVNDIQYEGTVSVTKNSSSSFTQTVSNGKCSQSGWSILWNSTRTISLTVNPLDPNADVATITGTANGTDRNGKTFSVDITTPLRREMGCRWIVSGAMTLKLEGKKDRTINFGSGTCDNRATLIIAGNEFEFELE